MSEFCVLVISFRHYYNHLSLPQDHCDGGRYSYLSSSPRDTVDIGRQVILRDRQRDRHTLTHIHTQKCIRTLASRLSKRPYSTAYYYFRIFIKHSSVAPLTCFFVLFWLTWLKKLMKGILNGLPITPLISNHSLISKTTNNKRTLMHTHL